MNKVYMAPIYELDHLQRAKEVEIIEVSDEYVRFKLKEQQVEKELPKDEQ